MIKQLFDDQKYQEVVNDLIMSRKHSDEALEQEVAKAFVERAEVGVGDHTMHLSSNAELDAYALSFMGLHHSGEPVIKDKLFIDTMMPVILERAMGESTPIVNEDIGRALLAHAKERGNSPYSDQVKKNLDSFLNKERIEQLLRLSSAGQIDSPLSDEEIGEVAAKYDIELPISTPPRNDEAKLSTRVLQPDIGELASSVERDALRHRLDVDLQTEAQMNINRIMDENPNWVHRTVVDKLKDRVINGVEDLTNPSKLAYPSESIFGRNLSEVDDNGRVVRELLGFKSDPFRGERCIFPSAKVPDTVYKVAVEHLRKSGIQYPHITTNQKNPQDAIHFMRSSVMALIEAGYDIDDITVGRNVQKAFEKMKNEGLVVQNTISEAPEGFRPGESPPDEEPENKREMMPEEVLEAEREKIHEAINYIKDGINSEDNPSQMSDMPNDKLVAVLGLYSLMSQSSENWNESVREFGVSPAGRETVEQVKAHFDKLVAKCGEDPGKVGNRQAETLYEARGVLPSLYSKDELMPVRDVLQTHLQNANVDPAPDPDNPHPDVSEVVAAEQGVEQELDYNPMQEADTKPPSSGIQTESEPPLSDGFEKDPVDPNDGAIPQEELDVESSIPIEDGPPSYLNEPPLDDSGYIPEEDPEEHIDFDGPEAPTRSDVSNTVPNNNPVINNNPEDSVFKKPSQEDRAVEDDLGIVPDEAGFDVLDHSVEHSDKPTVIEPEDETIGFDVGWGDDYVQFDPSNEEWQNISKVNWSELSSTDLELISNLSPADKIELSQTDSPKALSANLPSTQIEQLALNIRQVDMLLSADRETLEDLSPSEMDMLSRLPDSAINEDHKAIIEMQKQRPSPDEEDSPSLRR